MRLLPKQIGKETFHYYSERSVDGLKYDIQQVIGDSSSVNLVGEFISDSAFAITPRWQIIIIKNFERESSYLDGHIFQDEVKKTRVTFTVRPNSVFAIMFCAFPLFGVFALTDYYSHERNEASFLAGLAFMFIVPAIMLVAGAITKQGIKDRFVKTFDLKPVEEK